MSALGQKQTFVSGRLMGGTGQYLIRIAHAIRGVLGRPMSDGAHQWISLHRVRFPSAISALERNFSVPSLPECWRFCPSLLVGEDDLPTYKSDTWGGLGIYDDRNAAEAMVSAAEQHLPFLSETVEQWHALLLPFAHRGAVNWRGTVQDRIAIRTTSQKPEGPLVVITSAGFNSLRPDQRPRFVRFNRGIQDVIKFYSQVEGNLRRDVFVGEFDRRDSFTVTLWRNDKAMLQGAYHDGTHRTLMDQSRDGSFFDRSSFTRARLISSSGSWDGNPLSDRV
jgi:hypothetical protein